MNVKSKFDLRRHYSRKVLLFVSLLFMIMLSFSGFVSVFNTVSSFAFGTSNVMVENEIELVNAVNNAIEPTIITLARDIILTGALIIPDNKDITLTSNNNAKFFKLIRADSCNTIIVDKGGTLKLDGIIITHNAGSFGTGITVNSGGQLTMIDGEISGNNGGNGYGDVYVVGPL